MSTNEIVDESGEDSIDYNQYAWSTHEITPGLAVGNAKNWRYYAFSNYPSHFDGREIQWFEVSNERVEIEVSFFSEGDDEDTGDFEDIIFTKSLVEIVYPMDNFEAETILMGESYFDGLDLSNKKVHFRLSTTVARCICNLQTTGQLIEIQVGS